MVMEVGAGLAVVERVLLLPAVRVAVRVDVWPLAYLAATLYLLLLVVA
jgi:hypothetical protein